MIACIDVCLHSLPVWIDCIDWLYWWLPVLVVICIDDCRYFNTVNTQYWQYSKQAIISTCNHQQHQSSIQSNIKIGKHQSWQPSLQVTINTGHDQYRQPWIQILINTGNLEYRQPSMMYWWLSVLMLNCTACPYWWCPYWGLPEGCLRWCLPALMLDCIEGYLYWSLTELKVVCIDDWVYWWWPV